MSDENLFLVYAIYTGVYITFLYDLIRIARRVIRHNTFLVSLEDIVFWVYVSAKFFLLMYRYSNGLIRWYAVLGALAGMLVYKKAVSGYFVKYISLFFLKIKEIVGGFFRMFLRPAAKFFYFLKKKLTILLKLLKMSL